MKNFIIQLILGILLMCFLLIAFEVSIYFLAPFLPINFVRKLSVVVQQRYVSYHKDDISPRYIIQSDGERCKYNYIGNPMLSGMCDSYGYKYDKLGYRNPDGILNKKIEVLLLGDSFTEGDESDITIADNMRKRIMTYSAGVAGNNSYHWICNYRRYVNSKHFRACPKYVILNICFNDFQDMNKDIVETNKEGNAMGNRFHGKFTFFNNARCEKSSICSLLHQSRLQPLQNIIRSDLIKTDTNWQLFEERIIELSEEIKKCNGTELIVSYIPTAIEIEDYFYRQIKHDCSHYINQRKELSEKIKNICDKLNIRYYDSSPEIYEFSHNIDHTIYMLGGHFSVEGYAFYSNLLEKLITKDKYE
jgi:lysophospholipase L1-like esterase